jgi:maleylpyruvate isomerase
MSDLAAAREALRLRQGRSARYDSSEAPAQALAQARLATAYFARKLNELNDAALYRASLHTGWTRAHVVCDVAYQARALSRQIEAASAGAAIPALYDSADALVAELELGATLPPHAIRHLFDHSAIHLNVVWRDLSSLGWEQLAADKNAKMRSLRQTPHERAAWLWQSVIKLGNGARTHDIPTEFQSTIH